MFDGPVKLFGANIDEMTQEEQREFFTLIYDLTCMKIAEIARYVRQKNATKQTTIQFMQCYAFLNVLVKHFSPLSEPPPSPLRFVDQETLRWLQAVEPSQEVARGLDEVFIKKGR